MPDSEPLIWYAEGYDPDYALLYTGAFLALEMVVLVCVEAFRPRPVLYDLAIFTILMTMVVVSAIGDELFDRRALVEIRLTPTELTLTRANRSTATRPMTDLRRIEVTRALRNGTPTAARMRLRFGDGAVLRTRLGPPDLPDQWAEALNAAEVDIEVRERNHDD